MSIKSEDWILLTLRNTSERNGLNLTNWYSLNRPDELELSFPDFSKIIDEMEDNGLLRRASSIGGNHCLTDKGKKEVLQLKKRLDFDDYYYIISKFPIIELRERIETLEFLIITSFGLFWIVLLEEIPLSSHISNLNILFVYLSLIICATFLLSLYFGSNFSKILIIWIINLRRDKWLVYKEWLWNNQNIIIYPVPILFAFIILFAVYIMDIATMETIIFGLAIFIVCQLILKFKKIINELKSKFEMYFK